MLDRICLTYRQAAAANPDFAAAAKELRVEKMIELLQDQLIHQQELERCRAGGKIWVLHPAAWKARHLRNAKTREIARLRDAGLRLLFPSSPPSPASLL